VRAAGEDAFEGAKNVLFGFEVLALFALEAGKRSAAVFRVKPVGDEGRIVVARGGPGAGSDGVKQVGLAPAKREKPTLRRAARYPPKQLTRNFGML